MIMHKKNKYARHKFADLHCVYLCHNVLGCSWSADTNLGTRVNLPIDVAQFYLFMECRCQLG